MAVKRGGRHKKIGFVFHSMGMEDGACFPGGRELFYYFLTANTSSFITAFLLISFVYLKLG